MNCYDKLKIITKINYIDNINNNEFISHYKDNELLYYKYQQKSPYSLLIMINYIHNELVIEFTSKILKERFVELINKNNIKQCLNNINDLYICSLDVDSILIDSSVVKCDETKVIGHDSIKEIVGIISTNITNHRKWITKPYKNGGIVIENIASTARYKKRLSFYDKSKELLKSENSTFLNSLKNKSEVLRHYNDKIHVELNINTIKQIKELLMIPNNNLNTVLNTEHSAILNVFDEAVKISCNNKVQNFSWRDSERKAMLEICDYDLIKVEMNMRNIVSKNTSITKTMKPYVELYHRLQTPSRQVDIRKLIA